MGRIICIKIGVKNRSVKYFFDNTITLYGGGVSRIFLLINTKTIGVKADVHFQSKALPTLKVLWLVL